MPIVITTLFNLIPNKNPGQKARGLNNLYFYFYSTWNLIGNE